MSESWIKKDICLSDFRNASYQTPKEQSQLQSNAEYLDSGIISILNKL